MAIFSFFSPILQHLVCQWVVRWWLAHWHVFQTYVCPLWSLLSPVVHLYGVHQLHYRRVSSFSRQHWLRLSAMRGWGMVICSTWLYLSLVYITGEGCSCPPMGGLLCVCTRGINDKSEVIECSVGCLTAGIGWCVGDAHFSYLLSVDRNEACRIMLCNCIFLHFAIFGKTWVYGYATVGTAFYQYVILCPVINAVAF